MTKTKPTPPPYLLHVAILTLLLFDRFYIVLFSTLEHSLCLHVIRHEGLAFHSAFFNIHRSGVLTVLMWLESCETAAPNVLFTSTPCIVTNVTNQIKTEKPGSSPRQPAEKPGSSPPVNQCGYTDAIKTEIMIRNCTGSTKVFTVQNLMDLPKTSPPKNSNAEVVAKFVQCHVVSGEDWREP